MFAIVLWDELDDTLWLVRDKIGVKPLYFTEQNGRIYFASEIKAIIEDKSIERAIATKGLLLRISTPLFITIICSKHHLPTLRLQHNFSCLEAISYCVVCASVHRENLGKI